ncbi:sugar phosphate isomerase/epimerase [candidate division KSB1 bacterium]|nr:sugar phosphate isomerase/epimerase [candidate division KSB1 bacterium]
MKLSMVLSTQPASFSAVAFKGRLAENIAKISDLGYDGVELAVRDPQLLDREELQRLLSQHNLQVPAIGTGQAYGEEGLYFTHPNENIRRRAVERIQSQMYLAAELNAVVIIGLVRGKKSPGISDEQVEEWLIQALTECARVNPDVKLSIELINRYETDILNTVTEGMNFVQKIQVANIGLHLDTFHMNIEEPSMVDSIVLAKEKLFHFHVADSNRWYPGAGHIDFEQIIKTLEKIGYNGYVSAEIMPLPDPDTAAVETIKYLRKFI